MLKTYDFTRLLLLSVLLWVCPPLQAEQQSATLTQAAPLFQEASFDKTREAVDLLAASGDAEAVPYLQALLDGQLYQHKAQGTLVIAKDGNTGDELRKIPTNNSLRKYVRAAVGQLSLSHPDAAVRLKSANGLLETVTPEMATQLRGLLEKETDAAVKEALSLGLAMADLNAADKAVRLAAIESLAGNLHPGVRNRLTTMTTDSDAAVAKAAQEALRSIEDTAALYGHVETLFFGLSLGSVLVLAAIGLAITFGVMGVINMAHGELMMIGAYCAYVVQLLMPNHIGWSIAVAIPVAFLVSGLVGVLIERFVVRYLYGRPLETLLATFGISLILQQAVRSVFSPLNRLVQSPEWMSGAWEVMPGLSITWNRVYIFIFCLLCFFTLLAVMKRTRLGLEVRAVSQNRHMARAMGISDRKVDMLTFGLGSGIAGVAGVALSQLTNVGPNLGQQYIVDSFMVVVVGGVGNLWGTLVSGLTLGVLNKLFEPWLGAVLAKAIVLVLIILFIQKYPRGLFPQKGRGVE